MAQAPRTDRADPTPSAKPAEASSEVRQDPKPRRFDPAVAGQVRDPRPDRVYLFCDPRENRFGLQHHIDQGWTLVDATVDKERVYSGRIEENGHDVTYEGQFLVWMDKGMHQEMLDARQAVLKARQAKAKAPGGIDGVTSPAPPGERPRLAENMNH
jgi:hypothetical protein